jgi:dolichol-phosphate mannosyltransferase
MDSAKVDRLTPRLSLAIPLLNERQTVPELYRRVSAVLDALSGGPHEMVFIDDGSTDGTPQELGRLATNDPRIRVVVLSRNFGHQAAITAGMDHVSGDVVVTMDGDLQDAPEEIPRLLAEYVKGFDVVYAIRASRQEGALMRACYATFYRTIRWLANIQLPEGAGDFALLSRRVIDEIRRSPERHRYLRGLRAWVGFRQTGIEVNRQARHGGQSKYTFRKLVRLALDGIVSFSAAPLRAATLAGGIAIGIPAIYSIYALVAKIFWQRPPEGFTALIMVITFLAGIQFLLLGVIGEYIGRTYDEVKQRPHYIVDRVIDGTAAPEIERL